MGGRPATDRKVIDQTLTLYDSKTYSVTEITKTGGISSRTLCAEPNSESFRHL